MDLERLKAVRAAHRGVITKLTGEVDEALSSTTPVGDKVGCLNVIFEQLQNKLTVLQKIDNKILTACSFEHIEREIEESEAISAMIFDYKRRIKVFLRPLPTGSSSPPASIATSDTTPAVTTPVARTRLPKLEQQKFIGNVTSWMSFWDSFKAATHDNPNISKIYKFTSLLEGVASKVVQGLTLTESNYDSAVGLLQERFGINKSLYQLTWMN